MTKSIKPDAVLKLTAPTKRFLCPVSANRYGISFKSFSISDHETKACLFRTGENGIEKGRIELDVDLDAETEDDVYRKIRYTFSERVLRIPRISTSLTFAVGDEPLPNFRMIERHYFRDELIKSYDFDFGFCIPGSTNSWEAVYETPSLPDEIIDLMVRNPFETYSDTFYFVGEELVMHHKVSYKYNRDANFGMDEKMSDESKFQNEDDDFVHFFGEAKIEEEAESKAGSKESAGEKYYPNDGWCKDTAY